MLMPLYQGQGTDGFFLCREASRSWLAFSTWARTSGLEAYLPALPGVERHGSEECELLVDRSVGPTVEWWLRLFGYRKHSSHDGREVYARRRETGMR